MRDDGRGETDAEPRGAEARGEAAVRDAQITQAPRPDDGRPDPGVAGYGKAYGIIAASLQLVVAVVLMLFLGRWLDGKFGTAPWLMLAGLMTGFAGGFYSFLRSVKKLAVNDENGNEKR